MKLTGECIICRRDRVPIGGLCPHCGHPLEVGSIVEKPDPPRSVEDPDTVGWRLRNNEGEIET